jgi:hypothetical protein
VEKARFNAEGMKLAGDIDLGNVGDFKTTLQLVTPTANRTITFPDLTGTIGLIAGSTTEAAYSSLQGGFTGAVPFVENGALTVSNGLGYDEVNGILSVRGGFTTGGAVSVIPTLTGNTTFTGRIINSVANAASAPAGSFTGTWFTTGTSTTTKPSLLVEQSGATSTGWNATGTGLGVNSASTFAGRLLDLQKNGTTVFNVLHTGDLQAKGDLNLDDGGSFTTTLQTVTATQNNTISFPNATGTIGLVSGSTGQLIFNDAGAYSGLSTVTTDGTNVTLTGRFIGSLNGAASAPPATLTGTWFTGGTATTTKPQFLIEPSGATSTAWSTSGTGLGVNAASGFAGQLLDAQVNGTSRMVVTGAGRLGLGTSSPSYLLDVNTNHARLGNTSGVGLIQLGSSSTATQNFHVGATGSTVRLWNGDIGAGSELLRVTSDGKVGLGASSPSERLDLGGGVSDTVKIRFSMGGNIGTIGSVGSGVANGLGNLTFFTRNGSSEVAAMTIDGSQRVGIGTTSPATTLDVNGDVTITDKIIHGGDTNTAIRFPAADTVSVETAGSERARIDSSGRLLVGTSTATGPAVLQVETPTTLATTLDAGVRIANTSAKTYPTTASFEVTAGLDQNIELGTAQTIDTVTPGGFNYVTGTNIALTKSAGNTQDIERLYFNGFRQSFTWTDANTCNQYIGFNDNFNYSGFNANSRTSVSFRAADTIILAPPDTRTQTITRVASNALWLNQKGTSTVNITDWSAVSPSLRYINISAGTKTSSITNAAFYDTTSFWGVMGTTGTLDATITNLFGLRLRPPFGTTGLTITNNWGLYQEWSSAKNWFAGESNQFPNLTTTASGANAFLDSGDSNRLYLSTSSLIYKRDVEDLDSDLADQILNLRPVWYRSKCDADCQDWSWYGFIAEEVAEIDPRFVHYGYQEDAYEFVEVTETVDLSPEDPRIEEGIETEEVTRQQRQLKADAQKVPNGVAYERLVVPLLDIIKRQKNQIELIETRLAALEAQ